MKRILALSLICLLLLGCQREQPAQTGPSEDLGELTAVSLLSGIWKSYDENHRFAACGGTTDRSADDAPGAWNLANTEELAARYLVPEDKMEVLTEGASLVHMMNSHIFTACAVRISGDETAFVEAWRQNIQSTQWLCSWPDRLLIARVGDFILLSFGLEDNMSVFRQTLVKVYPNAEILTEEAITL